MLTSELRNSELRTWGTSGAWAASPLKVDFGRVGYCAQTPDLTISAFDDSASLTVPGGGDPVGNRYEESRLAYAELRRCNCGNCLGAVVHFDTPHGEVKPGPLKQRWFQRQLEAGLAVPAGALGVSLIGPALTRAEAMAADHPDHRVTLVALTDWQLFDSAGYIERLQAFSGEVVAVGLNSSPPAELESDHVRPLRIDHQDEPGTLARALFGALVSGRRNADPK